MFENLIESKPKKDKTLGQTIASIIVHVILIFLAVKATQGAAEQVKKIINAPTMTFMTPPPPPPPPPPPRHSPMSWCRPTRHRRASRPSCRPRRSRPPSHRST